MKIGIIGTGNMGRVLGGLWAIKGHDVFFGARDTLAADEARRLADKNGATNVRAGSNDDAAAFGDVLLYSPRAVDPRKVIKDISAFDGKVVIDLNNWSIPENFEYEPVIVSLAERLQAQLPKSHVVKAFNTMAQEVLEASPEELTASHVSAYIATDHQPARTAVETLARDLNLTPVDAGPLRMARLLESVGDFIRYLIIGKTGAMTTINIALLGEPDAQRFGPHSPSYLDADDDRVHVKTSRIIDAPIETLWAKVANFQNVVNWHPDVTESSLLDAATGTEPGDKRQIQLRDGTLVREKLLAIDTDLHRYTYSVDDGQLPLRDHMSTVSMLALNDNSTEVIWTASFRPVGIPAADLANGVRSGVIELGLDGLAESIALVD
jgi:8-hydroxy-5-deazaflavin:NADPH oxidoreductase